MMLQDDQIALELQQAEFDQQQQQTMPPPVTPHTSRQEVNRRQSQVGIMDMLNYQCVCPVTVYNNLITSSCDAQCKVTEVGLLYQPNIL